MKQQYILLAIHAALRAGEEIRTIYNDPAADFEVEMKADHSPLTIADRKAHEAIARVLAETPFPVLSEEGRSLPYDERCLWDTLWIVDPLDGTKEFIKRNGEFTVNIALVNQGTPVAGVVYVPVKQLLYFAVEGLGAYRMEHVTSVDNASLEQLMAASSRLPLGGAAHDDVVVVASRSHLNSETEDYINSLRNKLPDKHVTLISCGSSIKICSVAEGRADVYPRFAPTMEWDTAAGHAIARMAGYEMYRAGSDEPLAYNKDDLLNPWFIVEGKRK